MKYTVIASKGPFADIRTAAFAEERIDWWDDGQSAAQAACTIAFAATELEKFLPGQVLLTDSLEQAEGTVLVLGLADHPLITKLSQAAGKNLAIDPCCSPESFRMVRRQINGTDYVILSGADRVGVLYAAYAYLEKCGITFIEPGAPCTNTEAAPETEFDVTESPSYITRGTMSAFIHSDEEFLLWVARNRFNSGFFRKANYGFALRKKLGIDTVVGGHQMFYLFADTAQEYPYKHAIYGGEGKPEDPYPVSPLCRAPSGPNGTFTYGDAHPEWYALIDNERRMLRFRDEFLKVGNAPGDNMCTSNMDAVKELCRLIVDSLISGEWKYADHVHIWPLDNGFWCECEECKKIGNYSTRILHLAHHINCAIKEAYAQGRIRRKILLICPAYHETLPIPDQPLPEDFDYEHILTVFYPIERCYLHDLDDPICTETNQLMLERLLPWSNNPYYKGHLEIGEYYNVSTFAAMPFVLAKRILHEIPMYYHIGARHFHYMHITARDWGIIAINNFLHGKLLWNIHADPEALMASYFSARYGELAQSMRRLYEKIEQDTANCKYYKHYKFMNGKSVSLYSRLSSPDAYGVHDEDTLFPMVHMKLHGRADDPQAGPSLEETLQGLEDALRILQDLHAAQQQPSLNLTRDLRRLQYGVNLTRFTYLMCLCTIGQGDENTLKELREMSNILEADTESLQGYDFGDDFKNGLTASWVAKAYFERFAPQE